MGRSGEEKCGPAYYISRVFAGLIHEAAVHTRADAGVHAWPPVEALREVERARAPEVAGVIHKACVHDPGAHDQAFIDARAGGKRQGGGQATSGVGRRMRRVRVSFTSRRHVCPANVLDVRRRGVGLIYDGTKDGGGENRGSTLLQVLNGAVTRGFRELLAYPVSVAV